MNRRDVKAGTIHFQSGEIKVQGWKKKCKFKQTNCRFQRTSRLKYIWDICDLFFSRLYRTIPLILWRKGIELGRSMILFRIRSLWSWFKLLPRTGQNVNYQMKTDLFYHWYRVFSNQLMADIEIISETWNNLITDSCSWAKIPTPRWILVGL